jgi:hypothetical protein
MRVQSFFIEYPHLWGFFEYLIGLLAIRWRKCLFFRSSVSVQCHCVHRVTKQLLYFLNLRAITRR